MHFEDKQFVLAGQFENGDKSVIVKQMIEMCGGIVREGTNITNAVSYLVIGAKGSPSWTNGKCPQLSEVEKRQAAGYGITAISETQLFEAMDTAGVTRERWLFEYNKRLAQAKCSLQESIDSIAWRFDKSTKTLTIDNAILPDLLGSVEDFELVGIAMPLPVDAHSQSMLLFDEDDSNETDTPENPEVMTAEKEQEVRIRSYGPEDLFALLPWSVHAFEIEHIDACNLIEVPPALFSWMKNLESVNMPKARIIRSGAFYECRNLKQITMPNTLFIGNGAFGNCRSLAGRLVFPEIEHIGPFAFSGCRSIVGLSSAKRTKIRADGKTIKGVGHSLKFIGEAAFKDCSSMKSLSYDKGICCIQGNPFHGCKALKNKTAGVED